LNDLWKRMKCYDKVGIWPVCDQACYPGALTHRLQELLADLPSDGEAWLN
jgi:hypothetical protein